MDADIESSQIFHSRIMGKLIMMLFGGACLEKSKSLIKIKFSPLVQALVKSQSYRSWTHSQIDHILKKKFNSNSFFTSKTLSRGLVGSWIQNTLYNSHLGAKSCPTVARSIIKPYTLNQIQMWMGHLSNTCMGAGWTFM